MEAYRNSETLFPLLRGLSAGRCVSTKHICYFPSSHKLRSKGISVFRWRHGDLARRAGSNRETGSTPAPFLCSWERGYPSSAKYQLSGVMTPTERCFFADVCTLVRFQQSTQDFLRRCIQGGATPLTENASAHFFWRDEG